MLVCQLGHVAPLMARREASAFARTPGVSRRGWLHGWLLSRWRGTASRRLWRSEARWLWCRAGQRPRHTTAILAGLFIETHGRGPVRGLAASRLDAGGGWKSCRRPSLTRRSPRHDITSILHPTVLPSSGLSQVSGALTIWCVVCTLPYRLCS
ncbi:uncharacterized protein CC84DRAFT_890338 [Paraphaeosphaeria sporulosa]|uniref:Uncharacterized protein n=1 Tax=Paraphaeosphaeria sporulosa TaxID=1460663 RepID=A0A177CBD0_9PLEO|nr:uncharacterized protein CC84DRAFT_890338 [Paraphaeosphaeria sporulosa]OAG04162.1 hypothetical protein CC84DRAFT_890338 [Paraphaeosphaeria sporulosa]